MATLAIQGMQWGDEGKGKITDFYASKAEVVVRSQGGNNAGHSIVKNGHRYALRLLPSGVFNPDVTNVLADGMAINPKALIDEIHLLEQEGIASPKIWISNRAVLLLPYHIALDHAREEALGGAKIGTTGRGIGPCYEDRSSRLALRMGDLLDKEYLRARLSEVLPIKNRELVSLGGKPFALDELLNELNQEAAILSPYITDTSLYLQKAIKAGKKVLFEGAQGSMLCLEHGTYPYVTSSSPLATAIPLNAGIPLSALQNTIGIVKAYTTRVGAGPFPSEILDEKTATALREKGHEYGTVTKRPRRIGWLDIPELRYVIGLTGVHDAALMLLDVLSAVDEIKLVTAYSQDGAPIEDMPSSVASLARVKVETETLPSWKEDISNVRRYDDLPKEAKAYVEEVERLTGLSFVLISVGPDHDATIIRKEIF